MLNPPSNYRAALAGITSLFFVWGFVTVLNDVLQPILQNSFQLSQGQANLVQSAFFLAYFFGSLAYFLFSLRVGDPMQKLGYKRGMILGLGIAATGCLMFYPAAAMESFAFFLVALFTLALGFTLLQIAANPYVTLLGPPETASSRLNLSQAFNSFGTTLAPVLGGYALVDIFELKPDGPPTSVQVPYLLIALLMALLALFVGLMNLPKVTGETEIVRDAGALKHPALWLGMIAIFFYVGAEVSIGANLIKLMAMPSIAGWEEGTAKLYLAFYWGGAMIGRFLGSVMLSKAKTEVKLAVMIGQSAALVGLILLLTKIPVSEVYPFFIAQAGQIAVFMVGRGNPSLTLSLFSIAAMALLFTALGTDGQLALWLVISVGLFNSIMWSNIFSLGIAGLGRYTAQGSSLLVMMILGGAVLPPLMGFIADGSSLHSALIVPAAAYIYLAVYGFYCYSKNNNSSVDENKASV